MSTTIRLGSSRLSYLCSLSPSSTLSSFPQTITRVCCNRLRLLGPIRTYLTEQSLFINHRVYGRTLIAGHARLSKSFCLPSQMYDRVDKSALSSLFIISRCSYATAVQTTSGSEIRVRYEHGLAILSVPLPSRDENCLFTVRPITSTLGDFIDQLQAEDRGVDYAAVYSLEGERIAKTTAIDILFRTDFQLHINHQVYHVKVPEVSVEHMQEVSDVKNTIVKLYRALNVEQFQIEQERQLLARLEHLRTEVSPLEKIKTELEQKAVKRVQVLTWLGLGLMGVQFGFLARLTWWEYSWDIMEPVTYFVGYASLMAMFAYYVVTKQEYTFPEVRDREYLLTMHREANKKRLDLERYNKLRNEIAQTEYDIARLRDPLQLNLPLQHLAKKIVPDSDPFK